jgi:hypothetical protein
MADLSLIHSGDRPYNISSATPGPNEVAIQYCRPGQTGRVPKSKPLTAAASKDSHGPSTAAPQLVLRWQDNNEQRRVAFSATVARDSGIRGRGARKERADDQQKGQKVSTRQYLQIRERRGLVREILSRSRRSTETCSTRTCFRDGREASTDRVGRHCCFIEQEPGARSGQEAEYLFRRSILPEIGGLCCRDRKAEHLRTLLRKLAGTDLSYESVSKVKFAMKDMVKRMVAEEYLTTNIAEGLKTPKTATRSDRSRLRRVSLAEYVRAWTVLDERERIAFDLVTFCGLRESEAYGLRNGDLFQQGAIRVQRS